jgi:hypothetical protein
MMIDRILKIVVLIGFLNNALGCAVHTAKDVTKEDLQVDRQSPSTGKTVSDKILEVVYPTGETIIFDDDGGIYDAAAGVIRGRNTVGTPVEIDIDDILYVRVERVAVGASVLKTIVVVPLWVAGSLIIVGLAAAPFSCPYIYSFDGEMCVFDAEPLGGSVSRGLQREDYSKLEHLQPVDGTYRLMVRNETDETQYIDEIKLIAVDHAPGSEVVPDHGGNMHVVAKAVALRRAVDENGTDLKKFLEKQDGVAWQTQLPTDDSFQPENLRHELVLEFPKPRGATSAKLIVNAGTALWGSNMIKEMLQMRGDKVDAWYESIDTGGSASQDLFNFNAREELYFLKYYIKEGDEWRMQGWIHGGGPLVTEDRAIPLDLSRVAGDNVTIRVNPPMGFWAIDYMALEFDDHPAAVVIEQRIEDARDQDGKEVADLMSTKDDRYQVMPRIGDWIEVEFEVPPRREGTKRTVFLQSHGYYEIHIDKNQPEQTALIAEIMATDGLIVEYSMDEYVKWHSRLLSGHN